MFRRASIALRTSGSGFKKFSDAAKDVSKVEKDLKFAVTQVARIKVGEAYFNPVPAQELWARVQRLQHKRAGKGTRKGFSASNFQRLDPQEKAKWAEYASVTKQRSPGRKLPDGLAEARQSLLEAINQIPSSTLRQLAFATKATKPHKGLTPYFLWASTQRANTPTTDTKVKLTDATKDFGAQWAALSNEEKERWRVLAGVDKTANENSALSFKEYKKNTSARRGIKVQSEWAKFFSKRHSELKGDKRTATEVTKQIAAEWRALHPEGSKKATKNTKKD